MIEFSHLYKVYPGPIQALSNINLKIDKGEFVFLTGPSGAGKTTLFKMLSAYDKPSSGTVQVGRHHVAELSAAEVPKFRRSIGVVFQDFRLLRSASVFDNVAMPLRIRGESREFIARRVSEVLEHVGLQDRAHQYPEFISGGEQQRTAIARAIVHFPEVLIADEPTGNLDPDLSEEIVDLFERVSAQGTTVFIATHDLELVQRRRKRQIEIKDGEITQG
jgi:cell division transport system ATP-binding protein